MTLDRYVSENMDSFELIMKSTNHVYRFHYENESYILKQNHMSYQNLSPFWYAMKRIFHSDFDSQRKHMPELLSFIKKNPYINIAELISIDDIHRYQIFREAGGVKYQADKFPALAGPEYQLGLFIGYLHSIPFDTYGLYPPSAITQEKNNFKSEMLDCMSEMIRIYWKDDKILRKEFVQMYEADISPSSYSLIMPDISANQFVYSENLSRINAMVDFDAYVIGPQEWELCILELCLQDGKAFKQGYETWKKLPDISAVRSFYRFFSYLCDPWEKRDLEKFLTEAILF